MSRTNNLGYPLAYHITFTCYGIWSQNIDPGSVHPAVNALSTPPVYTHPYPVNRMPEFPKQPPYLLDSKRRKIALNAIRKVCSFRKWELIALHVRSTHIHAMLAAYIEPEKILNDFKAYASRALNKSGLDEKDRKRWARHGSTEYLWDDAATENVYNYVVYGQGEPMELYVRV